MDLYSKFIKKYKNQNISINVYTEKHHIIPRYLKGNNKNTNIITLTYRQHILAHLLLYRKYKNPEDKCAYNLMRNISSSKKQEIGKMIGEKNVLSGHIQKLGRKNAETGWINKIKTKESLSQGGKAAGKIAKETGQILKIGTINSCRKGGLTQGNKSKISGQIQSIGKYKGIYILIMPDGKEFLHTFQAAEYMKLPKQLVNSRCKQGNKGFSRRLKLSEEKGMYGKIQRTEN